MVTEVMSEAEHECKNFRADRSFSGVSVLIACENLKPEIEALSPREYAVHTEYVDHDYHRTPEYIGPRLQEEIDIAAAYATRIVLGYGLCSHGTVGLKAPPQGLWIPRVHDCIALYLGARASYEEQFRCHPGTYYLTKAWIANERDPLGIVEKDYSPRVGSDTAWWAMKEELKNYTRIVYIDTMGSSAEGAALAARARENARRLDKEYIRIPGSNAFFDKLVKGPYTKDDFVYVEEGAKVESKSFEK